MGAVAVRRDVGWADRLRAYRIVIDGVEVGQLRQGEELRHDLTDGPHTLSAEIDWCGGGPISIDGSAAEQCVVVRNALRGWRIWLVLVYVVFLPRRYLRLELLGGRAG